MNLAGLNIGVSGVIAEDGKKKSNILKSKIFL
jgi:hypothetical protein